MESSQSELSNRGTCLCRISMLGTDTSGYPSASTDQTAFTTGDVQTLPESISIQAATIGDSMGLRGPWEFKGRLADGC